MWKHKKDHNGKLLDKSATVQKELAFQNSIECHFLFLFYNFSFHIQFFKVFLFLKKKVVSTRLTSLFNMCECIVKLDRDWSETSREISLLSYDSKNS